MKEIVIKIPDETLNVLMEHEWNDKKIVTEKALKTLEDAFFDGEILPKGHGELKDMKKVKQAVNNLCVYHGINKADFIASIDINLDTIDILVEADKGE